MRSRHMSASGRCFLIADFMANEPSMWPKFRNQKLSCELVQVILAPPIVSG